MNTQSKYRHNRIVALLWRGIVALAAIVPCIVANAQENGAAAGSELKEAASPAITQGLWPSGKLLDIMLARWAEESCAEYDLDREQTEKARDAMVQQWHDYLTDHRSEIQPLMNEFLEMKLDVNPPSNEQVKAWAEKAIPVFEKTREQINKSHDAFREVMKPAQRLKFETDVLKMNLGMGFAEDKLKSWKRGEFDADDIWEGKPADREHQRAVRRRREAEREKERQIQSRVETDQIANELTAWEKYVAEFAVRFSFDESQRNAAQSFLSELETRAHDHRERHRDEIAEMESHILNHKGSDAAAADIKNRLATLYGPIDDMFKELKSRLNELPTSNQRAAVEESERNQKQEANRPQQIESSQPKDELVPSDSHSTP
ncbi:MAG: hypothetical protein HY287_10370 [Planctomycetes bacterium]|nr:hypothetical protein [Planctomycetota bacterium]MBI3834721.1 hypothetical protein [Planctomycetota bacterium]